MRISKNSFSDDDILLEIIIKCGLDIDGDIIDFTIFIMERNNLL